jgi:hypothetical protein
MRIRWGCFLAVLVYSVVMPIRGKAQPFELYAQYTKNDDGKKEDKSSNKVIKIPLLDGTYILQEPNDAHFDGVYLLLKNDVLSKEALKNLWEIVPEVSCKSEKCQDWAKKLDLKPLRPPFSESPQLVFNLDRFSEESSVEPISVGVRVKFSQDYLCSEELKIRAEKHKYLELKAENEEYAERILKTTEDTQSEQKKPEDKNKKKDSGKPGYSQYAYGIIVERGLETGTNDPIIYSICGGANDQIDWQKVAEYELKAKKTQGTADVKEVHERHKARLADLIKIKLAPNSYGDTVFEKHGSDERPNFYARYDQSVFLITDWAAFRFVEVTNTETLPLPRIIDKTSGIKLQSDVAAKLCTEMPRSCTFLLKNNISVYLEFEKDGKTVSNAVPIKIEDDHAVRLQVDLAEYVGQEITFRVVYKTQSGEYLEIGNKTARVENIGIITTFPAVTEIVTAISKSPKSASDIGIQSSIPLSWAINLKKGGVAQAAVTFPWMIGFNTRTLPRLAEIIKIFPHVSVIFPVENSGDDTAVALGGGVALANAFTFAIGTTVKKDTTPYILVGVSVPDIAKVWR